MAAKVAELHGVAAATMMELTAQGQIKDLK
jgi:hypothetical protein